MGIRRNTIWETLGINVTKTESQAQTGYRPYLPHPRIAGVEEGVITSGVIGGTSSSSGDRRTDQKFEQAGGDSSTILEERHRGSNLGGTSIRWNITSGPVVHTSYKNTTRYLGPHGEVLYEETVTSDPEGVQTANRFGSNEEVHRSHTYSSSGQDSGQAFDGNFRSLMFQKIIRKCVYR